MLCVYVWTLFLYPTAEAARLWQYTHTHMHKGDTQTLLGTGACVCSLFNEPKTQPSANKRDSPRPMWRRERLRCRLSAFTQPLILPLSLLFIRIFFCLSIETWNHSDRNLRKTWGNIFYFIFQCIENAGKIAQYSTFIRNKVWSCIWFNRINASMGTFLMLI